MGTGKAAGIVRAVAATGQKLRATCISQLCCTRQTAAHVYVLVQPPVVLCAAAWAAGRFSTSRFTHVSANRALSVCSRPHMHQTEP